MRAWQAQPGELYHQTSGERGGLWRLRGRPPQKLTASASRPRASTAAGPTGAMPDSFHKTAAWIFDGIGDDEVDRRLRPRARRRRRARDRALRPRRSARRRTRCCSRPPTGSPTTTRGVHEDILFNYNGLMGTQNPLVRADMVYFTTRNDGAVFSTGSIAWSPAAALAAAGTTTSRGSCATCSTRSPSPGSLPGSSSSRRRSRGGRSAGHVRPHRHRHRRAPRGRDVRRATRVWVTNPRRASYNVEWLRFEPDTPSTGPLRDRAARRLPGGGRRRRRSRATRCCSAPFEVGGGFCRVGVRAASTAPSSSSCSTRTPTRRGGSDARRRAHQHVPHLQRRGGLAGIAAAGYRRSS